MRKTIAQKLHQVLKRQLGQDIRVWEKGDWKFAFSNCAVLKTKQELLSYDCFFSFPPEASRHGVFHVIAKIEKEMASCEIPIETTCESLTIKEEDGPCYFAGKAFDRKIVTWLFRVGHPGITIYNNFARFDFGDDTFFFLLRIMEEGEACAF
jgi:hypothetical protein